MPNYKSQRPKTFPPTASSYPAGGFPAIHTYPKSQKIVRFHEIRVGGYFKTRSGKGPLVYQKLPRNRYCVTNFIDGSKPHEGFPEMINNFTKVMEVW